MKTGGCSNRLQVDSLMARCGQVHDGIGFSFYKQGGFVIDFEDLKKLVQEAEEFCERHPKFEWELK